MSVPIAAFLALLTINYVSCQETYTLCVTKVQASDRQCASLSSSVSEARCVVALDSVDCAYKLRTGEAHFAVFSSEQIALVAPDINTQATIIFQVTDAQNASLKYKFRTGVVVEKSFSGSLDSLRGMRYCHPGFGRVGKNDRIMKVFESKVVPKECSANSTIIENELNSVLNFFGNASCRPGRWTEDDDEEKALRQKYKTLCALCDDVDKCKNNPENNNHHYGALNCLTHKGGQVAYVSLDYAKEYFQTYSSYAANYSFLCPNGTKMDLNVAEPCAWYEEPFDAVVAANSAALKIQTTINSAITTKAADWTRALRELLQGTSGNLVAANRKLSDYVEGVTSSLESSSSSSSSSSSCQREIRWCTTSSMEQSKCNTLKQAAALNAIKPDLTCIQTNNVWECLNKTKRGETDILGIDTSLAYVAYKYFDLQPLKYQDSTDLDKTIAVIRSGAAKSFQDLKGKSACFPEFGGLAHLTIFEKLRSDTGTNAWLDGELLSDYFGKVCIPRTLQIPRDPRTTTTADDGNKFCTLCPGNSCVVDFTRTYLADARAIECMVNNTDSAAFINANSIQAIRANTTISSKFSEDQYRFMCKDGSALNLSQSVDETCAFSSHLAGVVVGGKNLTAVQKKDIDLALLKMDDLFGPVTTSWFFNMYETYNGVDDLLFKGKTMALASSSNKYVQEFERVMNSVFKYTASSGFLLAASSLATFLVVAVHLFIHRN